MARYFKGFSTIPRETDRSAALYLDDLALVKQDLANIFNTRLGERVNRPTYGSIIWDLIMEPFTSSVRDEIIEDVTRIIELDQRVELIDMQVFTYENGIQVNIQLLYIPEKVKDTFTLLFDQSLVEGN